MTNTDDQSDIRHQMRVTWMVRLTTTSGICEEVYFRDDVAPEADFEARVDLVLVRQHSELLVLAQALSRCGCTHCNGLTAAPAATA